MNRMPRNMKFMTLLALSIWASAAFCQTYPERPIQMVVPFGPGGTTDIMARLLQDELAKAIGPNASVIVVNTAGAGGIIGMSNVARAKPDGYTIAMTTIGPQTIQPARRENPPYTAEAFDYICGTYDVPVLTMVTQDSRFRTFKELVAWGKANPGKLNYGNSGVGTILHISMLELLSSQGVEALSVPYKSTGDMIVPLKSGQITMFNETPPVAIQHQLRPLLALSDTPVPGFESVPTAKSFGIAARGSVWGGLVAPKGLPTEIRNKLETACKASTSATVYKARAQAANNPLAWRTGEQFKAFALAEQEKYKTVVKAHNLYER